MKILSALTIGLFLSTLSTISKAQGQLSDCATYQLFRPFQIDYTKTFSPRIIKKEGIKEVLISVKSRKTNSKAILEDHKMHHFSFNNKGQATVFRSYNVKNEEYLKKVFSYNKAGKVVKETMHNFSWVNAIDHTYDSKHRLIKSKFRKNGKVVPDNQASHTNYQYDTKGRVIKKWSLGSSTSYQYNDAHYTAIQEITYNYGSPLKLKVFYDKKWNIIKSQGMKGRIYNAHQYTYDAQGRIIIDKSIGVVAINGECPQKGNAVDKFTYNQAGLISQIVHTYKDVIVTLTFDYKK